MPDVARGASDLILADDNFASIVAGVEEGRITYANIRKIVIFLLATGVAEIFMFLGALAVVLIEQSRDAVLRDDGVRQVAWDRHKRARVMLRDDFRKCAFQRRRTEHGDRAAVLAKRRRDVGIRLAAGAVHHVPAETVLARDLAQQVHRDRTVD